MTTPNDWTLTLKAYGESLGWHGLPSRRALRKFREWADSQGEAMARPLCAAEGIAAANALERDYRAMEEATAEERTTCNCREDLDRLVAAMKTRDAEVSKCRTEELLAASAARRKELDAVAGQEGWLLLAGENTDIVARGTRDQCRCALPLCTRLPRDGYGGRGCWVLLAPDGSEAETGYFDRDSAW